jgi:hypothetical protein
LKPELFEKVPAKIGLIVLNDFLHAGLKAIPFFVIPATSLLFVPAAQAGTCPGSAGNGQPGVLIKGTSINSGSVNLERNQVLLFQCFTVSTS